MRVSSPSVAGAREIRKKRGVPEDAPFRARKRDLLADPLDLELAQVDAEVEAAARARHGQGDFALGHRRALGALDHAGIGAAAGVLAVDLADAVDMGELTLATFDAELAGGEAATAHVDDHVGALAVVATDMATAIGLLVDRSPTRGAERHVALNLGIGVRLGGLRGEGTCSGECQD